MDSFSDFGAGLGLGEYESTTGEEFPMPLLASPPPAHLQPVSPPMSASRRGPPPGLFQPPAPHPTMMRHRPMAGMGADVPGADQGFPIPSFPAPSPTQDDALPTSHMLGLSVIMPATGSILGLKYAGMYGGLGGALAAGSVLNGYRAVKYMVQGNASADREAMISGTYAVLGLGAAAWLIWKGLKSKSPKALPNEDGELEGVQ